MGEKGKQKVPCAMERGRAEEMKAVRNRLADIGGPLVTRARVTSGPRLMPRTISESMAL